MRPGTAPRQVVVVAGPDGAGKSSIAGAALRERGGEVFDPDAATLAFVSEGLALAEANSRAWNRGRQLLERATRDGLSYAFETTLGGRTITRLLLEAAAGNHTLRVWYIGLASPELHVQRVKLRVAAGGHHVPEEKIRERWEASRKNLVRLLPHVSELVVYDNSRTVDIRRGEAPQPAKLLHLRGGKVRHKVPPTAVPDWVKPIFAAAKIRP